MSTMGNKIPKRDGKYDLPDRRILYKEGDIFTIINHSDKKKRRRLERLSVDSLKRLLQCPGYGSHDRDEFNNSTKEQLIRRLIPRTRTVFHKSWLRTSNNKHAIQLRELVEKAKLVRASVDY